MIRLPIDWDGVIPDLEVPFSEWEVAGTYPAGVIVAFNESLAGTTFTLVWDKSVDIETGVHIATDSAALSDRGDGLFYISNLVRPLGALFKVHPSTDALDIAEGAIFPEDNMVAVTVDSAALRASLGMDTEDLPQEIIDDMRSHTATTAIPGTIGAQWELAAAGGGGDEEGGVGVISYTWTEYQSGHDGDSNYVVPGVYVAVYANNTATGTPEDTGLTDETGSIVFTLDAGTYYLFRRKSGRHFSNPVTIIVS